MSSGVTILLGLASLFPLLTHHLSPQCLCTKPYKCKNPLSCRKNANNLLFPSKTFSPVLQLICPMFAFPTYVLSPALNLVLLPLQRSQGVHLRLHLFSISINSSLDPTEL